VPARCLLSRILSRTFGIRLPACLMRGVFDRCLWGTDWTRAFAVVNYEQAVEAFLRTDRLSDTERAMLMGGACAKAMAGHEERLTSANRGRLRHAGNA